MIAEPAPDPPGTDPPGLDPSAPDLPGADPSGSGGTAQRRTAAGEAFAAEASTVAALLAGVVGAAAARETELRRACLAAGRGRASYSTAAVWWALDEPLRSAQLDQIAVRLVAALELVDRAERLARVLPDGPSVATAAALADVRAAVQGDSSQFRQRWSFRPGPPLTDPSVPAGWYAATGHAWWRRPRRPIVPERSVQLLRDLSRSDQ